MSDTTHRMGIAILFVPPTCAKYKTQTTVLMCRPVPSNLHGFLCGTMESVWLVHFAIDPGSILDAASVFRSCALRRRPPLPNSARLNDRPRLFNLSRSNENHSDQVSIRF